MTIAHRLFLRHVLPAARLSVVAAAFAAAGSAFGQLQINFIGGPTIFDGGVGDLDNLTNGKIDFSGVYGPAGYQVSGTLQQSPNWPSGSSVSQQLNTPVYSITLTNFVAEALTTSTIGWPLAISFQSDPFVGVFGPGVGVDAMIAEVGHASGGLVPQNTDHLIFYDSAVTDGSTYTILAPSTGASLPMGNPFHVGFGTTAYPVAGHGPTPLPPMTNPWIVGLIELTLGQVGDQFILPTSYEIGFSPIPEASSALLAALGSAGVLLLGRLSRKRGASPSAASDEA